MILNTLRLANYKQYSHLELEFREGLVGIILHVLIRMRAIYEHQVYLSPEG